MADSDGFGIDQLHEVFGVSRETLRKLDLIIECLGEWRLRSNLIGPAEMDHIWRRHVFDSLQLLEIVPRIGTIIDLGSGAGFPALILAACRAPGDGEVIMVETVGKKCAFLREAVRAANLRAEVIHDRVENVGDIPATCVTARAFAPLPKLLDYAEPWLRRGAVGVFPKGRKWQDELTEAAECWKFVHEVIPSRSGGDGVILKITEVSRGRT